MCAGGLLGALPPESRRWDSNHRPIPYKGIALPAELLRPDTSNRIVRFVCNLDNVEHPKDVGDRSTLAIIMALREAGYGVLLPFGENTRNDLVVDDGCELLRVQCKTGRLRHGAVVLAVC